MVLGSPFEWVRAPPSHYNRDTGPVPGADHGGGTQILDLVLVAILTLVMLGSTARTA